MSGHEEAGSCEERSLLPELAVGSLNGAERAGLLTHLEGCQGCRGELSGLAATADSLLLLAPYIEPPVGFEVGLVQPAPGAGAARLRRRGRRRLGLAAAALVLLAAGAGIGGGLSLSSGPGRGSGAVRGFVRLAVLASKGGEHGVAALALGSPSRLVMRVSDLGQAYWVDCVVTDGRHEVSLGRFALQAGSGRWSVPLPPLVAPRAIRSAELLGPGGRVLARADFAH